MDDLKGFRVRKKQDVAKAKGVRSSIYLLTLTGCLEAFAETVMSGDTVVSHALSSSS